jgi:glycosyltransferase involved in cell wall biosynthesis
VQVAPVSARVSLIASTYRSERFLTAWLDSLQALTIWPDCELVVVANDPQPREDELLDAFCAKHPQATVIRVPREGVYRSWNRAIDASNAPLIALANVDDLRTPDGLQAQVEAMEADSEALFAYGPFHAVDVFPAPALPGDAPIVGGDPFDREAFTRSMLVGPFFLWRRSADPGLRYFDEQMQVGGDMDLAVRLAFRGHGVPVAAHLGAYYNGGTGLSTGAGPQPVELAVIELRYGIFDKLDYRHVPDALAYDLRHLMLPGGPTPIGDVLPDYEELLARRRASWGAAGLERWSRSFRAERSVVHRVRGAIGARVRGRRR